MNGLWKLIRISVCIEERTRQTKQAFSMGLNFLSWESTSSISNYKQHQQIILKKTDAHLPRSSISTEVKVDIYEKMLKNRQVFLNLKAKKDGRMASTLDTFTSSREHTA